MNGRKQHALAKRQFIELLESWGWKVKRIPRRRRRFKGRLFLGGKDLGPAELEIGDCSDNYVLTSSAGREKR